MNAMCRPCLCVLFMIGCISLAKADEKPNPKRTEYDRFLQPFTAKAPSEVPLKLIVTAIEGDEAQAGTQEPDISREVSYGCEILADGEVQNFHREAVGGMGAGTNTIPADDQRRLDKLLSKLPDDGARLPPPGRRVVLQVPKGGHCLARVYDRANAPDEVLEILRLSRSSVPSWVPEFKSERDVPVAGNYVYYGMTGMPPNRLAIIDRSFKYWDPARPKELEELKELKELPYGRNPQNIKFSPDGSLAVFVSEPTGRCCVMDTKTWEVVRNFEDQWLGGTSERFDSRSLRQTGVFSCSSATSLIAMVVEPPSHECTIPRLGRSETDCQGSRRMP